MRCIKCNKELICSGCGLPPEQCTCPAAEATKEEAPAESAPAAGEEEGGSGGEPQNGPEPEKPPAESADGSEPEKAPVELPA